MGLLQAYCATLTLAVTPIVLGSFSSLKISKKTQRLIDAQAGKSKDKEDHDEDDDEDDLVDRISFSDAYWFPVLGSVMLGGLYLLFKYVGKEWLNWAIGWYFTLAGLLAVFQTSNELLTYITPGFVSGRLPSYSVLIKEDGIKILNMTIPFLSLLLVPASITVPYFYVVLDKPWWINNILGFAFAHNAISLMRLDSFLTGSMLLSGLFLYDIFWVFGSTVVTGGDSVMVAVAKGLDAPVKLLFPKSWNTSAGFTMLGLGDIIIPGVFLALCLRLDYSLATRRSPSKPILPSSPFPKPYFLTNLLAYIGGLVTTIVVMHTFKAAQPALLYLSPACVGTVSLVAYLRGEWTELWAWSDADEEEEEQKLKEEKRQRKKQAKEAEAVEEKEDGGSLGVEDGDMIDEVIQRVDDGDKEKEGRGENGLRSRSSGR